MDLERLTIGMVLSCGVGRGLRGGGGGMLWNRGLGEGYLHGPRKIDESVV